MTSFFSSWDVLSAFGTVNFDILSVKMNVINEYIQQYIALYIVVFQNVGIIFS